jgi:glycosyltransferase involved in cell wall biosynthesis
MKILYVCPYYKPAYIYGGPVNSISALCEGLSQAGALITVFTTNANQRNPLYVPLSKAVDINGVDVWYFPLSYNDFSFFYSRSLTKAIIQKVRSFDLVIIDSFWSHPLLSAARSCIYHQVPYILPIRGQLNPWAIKKNKTKKTLYMKLISNRFINRASAIHCTDPLEARAVMEYGFRSPIIVVPNGIRASAYRSITKNGDLRRNFNIPNNAKILLLTGRITRIKRPDIAVDTLAATQSLGSETHLIIIGPDEDGLKEQLHDQAKRLGCDGLLHFTGLLKHESVISALAEADLLLMPSEIQENFGMSALEALAAGTPILVSDGIPVGRWAQIAGAGKVVTCTKDAFQKAVIELFSNPEQLEEMGQRGQNLIMKNFDIGIVGIQMLAHCQAIMSTGWPLPGTGLFQEFSSS